MSDMDEVCFHVKYQDTCPDIVNVLRNLIRRDVEQRDGQIMFPSKYRIYSIGIPRFQEYSELQNLYRMRYIDIDMQDDLERSEVLNWCRTAEPLYPIKTTGDGNCLLHAISQAMWGIEDSEMFLRRLLYLNIVTDPNESFKKRWLFHQRNNPDLQQADVRLNTVEVSQEWDMVIKATDDLTQSQTADLPYTALESIHLYVSANMLKRPIIVLADSLARNVFGQTLQDNQIGGIYLPLEWQPEQCNKNPIVIGYNMNHFCPLVLKGRSSSGGDERLQAVPIVTKQMDSLLTRFMLPHEESQYYNIIKKYLNMTEVIHNMTPVPAAKLNLLPLPNDENIVEANSRDCLSKWKRLAGVIVSNEAMPNQPQPQPAQFGQAHPSPNIPAKSVKPRSKHHTKPAGHIHRKRCVTVGCDLYADPELQNLCSKCFKEFTVQFANQEAAARPPPVPQRTVPVAPVAVNPPQASGGHQEEEPPESYHDLSMIGEDCQTGCGFKCSVETYPYCHECYPKYTQQGAVGPAVGAAPTAATGQWPGMSMMPDQCQNLGCGFKCSKATYPYCHSCYRTFNQSGIAKPTAPQPSVPLAEPSAPPPSVPVQPVLVNAGMAVSQAKIPEPIQPILNGDNHLGTQHEPMEVQINAGTLDKKCLTSTCARLAIKGNNGYCNECYEQAMFGGTPVISPTVAPGSKRPAHCSTPGCTEQLTPGTNHCTQCFLRGDISPFKSASLTGMTPMLNIQPSLKLQNLPVRPQMAHQSSEHDETYPMLQNQTLAGALQQEEQMALQKKLICSKPGCNGFRGMNDAELCDLCFQDPQRNMEIEDPQGGSDLENSQLFASCNLPPLTNEEMMKLNPIVKSSKDKVNCASHSCQAMIYPPKKLCDECSSVLQKYQAHKSMEQNMQSVGSFGAPCLTKGCQFFGVPETNGYCSSCHKSKMSMTRHSVPLLHRTTSSASNNNTAPLISRPATKIPTVPLVGKLCITPGCTRYGDPKQADRCSQHYEQEMMSSPHMSPESLQEQRNIIALQRQGFNVTSDKYNVAGVNYPKQTTQGLGQTGGRTSSSGVETRLKNENSSKTTGEDFDAVYNKLFSSKKTHKHCKNHNRGCTNFENPAKNGYCNTCHSKQGNVYAD